MSVDHIRYDILAQEALRGLVRTVLTDAARNGLPGDHHFFITFDTQFPGVRISPRLLAQYPEEMTIVLQHQFWDLRVADDGFEVGLSFGGVAERVHVPFTAITSFADPSVQFMLQFEDIAEEPEQAATPEDAKTDRKDSDSEQPKAKPTGTARQKPARTSVPQAPLPAPAAPAEGDDRAPPPDKPAGAQVVRLDRFRKK
jgi:hypothetical protein